MDVRVNHHTRKVSFAIFCDISRIIQTHRTQSLFSNKVLHRVRYTIERF